MQLDRDVEFPKSDSAVSRPAEHIEARAATVRLLRVLAAAALLFPILLFLSASWISYLSMHALATERIERSLDVMQEQALKVFESMTLALDSIDALVGSRSNEQMRNDEPYLHEQLKFINATLPEVQSIWVFGPAGHPQVITREIPAPSADDYTGLDYFTEPRDERPKIYVGGIHQSLSGGQPYFTFSRARRDVEGKFSGVIEMSLLPDDFSKFYSHLVTGPGLVFVLVRDDGAILARYPTLREPPITEQSFLNERSGFQKAIAADSTHGIYTSTSRVSGVQRRFGYRKVPCFPVYLLAGVDTWEIVKEWMRGMSMHLIFGIPATAFLFGAVLVVLRRTKRLYAEEDRREAAEMAIRQSQKLDAIGHLTGGVAHDFNNLLTVILGNLETAQHQLESWTDGAQIKVARRIENAIHGAERAATLTKRLLAFARQQPLSPTSIDVNRLLNGLADFLRRAFDEDISIEIVGGAGVWAVEADAAQLETSILNLAVNARDAMPDGGKLTIEASNSYLDDAYCRQHSEVQPGQYVQIAVTDTGAGMPKDIIERAFEPFFTTKPSGQGTGLGLSQVFGFVKQSGGHVKIYSEIGEGTTVKIYLPRFMGKYVPSEKKKYEPKRGHSDECVLVVEDDVDVCTYVIETLETLGYRALGAADGGQALELLKRHANVNVLLTDVVMPGLNGRKLADEAKQLRNDLKVVFMTGYSRNAIVHQGRLDPGVELIQKPLTSDLIATAIRRVLDQ